MSTNILTCRRCHQPMVRTNANGNAEFLARVERWDRHGPRGACLWLRCACDALRDWTPPPD